MAKTDDTEPKTPLGRACFIAGGQEALAKKIGTSQSQVWYWIKRAKHGVAPQYVLKIEEATGVSRHELRPDIYPAPEGAGAAA